MGAKRYPLIDYLRVLALFLMIIYHLVYDLDHWTNSSLDVGHLFWFLVGKTAALLFIFLSGFSCGLSHNPVKNGLKVMFFAMLVTIATYIVFPEQYVRFGILHFLALMMLIYPLLQKLPDLILILYAPLAIGLGFHLKNILVNTSVLLPLGLMYPGFASIDYFPIFPYSGVTALGILIYRYFAKSNKLQAKSKGKEKSPKKGKAYPMVTWISRHSLGIYLIHQPILLSIIYFLKALQLIT